MVSGVEEFHKYRGYARDIIIIPGSYAGTPTEWQKTTFTVHKSKQKSLISLNDDQLTLPLACHSICHSLNASAYPLVYWFKLI